MAEDDDSRNTAERIQKIREKFAPEDGPSGGDPADPDVKWNNANSYMAFTNWNKPPAPAPFKKAPAPFSQFTNWNNFLNFVKKV